MNTSVIDNPLFVFVSNYLNHHQIPFCNAMYKLCGGSFAFVQTEPVEEERIRMGWDDKVRQPYLKLYYREAEECAAMIAGAGIVMFGGCDDESYIVKRLEEGKPVIRCSERLYKTGQWKAVSPRGLRKKYHDHTRYRKAPVYLLCAGAYVPSDFSIVRAYPKKMYCWGYFPETKRYDLDRLMAEKGWREEYRRGIGEAAGRKDIEEAGREETGGRKGRIPYILWAARMIDWKHPELALEAARYLKSRGLSFHMDMIGGGELEERVRALRTEYGLEEEVGLPGFMPPAQVRETMERADIFLFTSDRQEGWGAVANEAMNSGCALIAGHMIGAVPYLIEDGENGLVYRDGDREELFGLAEKLVKSRELCDRLGRNAYRQITEVWNAENAAGALWELCGRLGLIKERKPGKTVAGAEIAGGFIPCAPAPVIPERKMYALLKKEKKR